MSLKRGTQQYRAACSMFGEEFVERLLEESEAKEAELVAKGIAFKHLGNKFARFWQSTRAQSSGSKSLAAHYFGG